jgi:caa(3)-type oxidase subunit IV
MSEPSSAPVVAHAAGGAAPHHTNYVRVWAVLVALLAVSVAGPFLKVRVVTLVTAFGVAGVKAYLVGKNFMHINLERRFVVYLVAAMLAFMLVMLGGVSPDVMKHQGLRWENVSAEAAVERGELEAQGASEAHE